MKSCACASSNPTHLSFAVLSSMLNEMMFFVSSLYFDCLRSHSTPDTLYRFPGTIDCMDCALSAIVCSVLVACSQKKRRFVKCTHVKISSDEEGFVMPEEQHDGASK